MTDYSPEAIAARLRQVEEARTLGLSLSRSNMVVRDGAESAATPSLASSTIDFEAAFIALTGNSPMRWQKRLFERMFRGDIPTQCDLPTGLGKTSVIPIWLIAFAAQVDMTDPITLPRRMIYVVNRRTVVDQATDIARRIRDRITDPESEERASILRQLRRLLLSSCVTETSEPLAISTLRGEMADNEEWKSDPARAAIIVGTVDMIGSKLLFSGYGDGAYKRSHHAGLTGQDAIIVHDEAHLTPAFSRLLRSIEAEQRRGGEPRPIRVIELSATSRSGGPGVLRLTREDGDEPIVSQRLHAGKTLRLHQVAKGQSVSTIVQLVARHEPSASKVLVYVRSPEDAQLVAKHLRAHLGSGAGERVALLTGTIRGHERDLLVDNDPVFLAMMGRVTAIDRSLYLVSTSAGEVGIDLDADHMVCDLGTLDAMIQRLGRVNRRGGPRTANVDVVVTTEDSSDFAARVNATRKILAELPEKGAGHDASPYALRTLVDSLDQDRRDAAWSPQPKSLPVTDILLDAWSLTSISERMPGRPEVAAYLHGLTNDPPGTWLAWRAEVSHFADAGMSADQHRLRDWFEACRVEARERLHDQTDRVREKLQRLLKNQRKSDERRDDPVVVLDERGNVEWSSLSKVADKNFVLAYRTVVLPVETGGLDSSGALDPEMLDPASDVADVPRERAAAGSQSDIRERWLLTERGGEASHQRLVKGSEQPSSPSGLVEQEAVALRVPDDGSGDEGTSIELRLMVRRGRLAIDRPETAKAQQTLADHLTLISREAEEIARALRLSEELSGALLQAAAWHDRGKASPVWQRYACSRDAARPLAKSERYLHPRALCGYRHELGSLLEAERDPVLSSAEHRELVLHLIASHHGWARPHFEPRAWDTIRFTTAANESAAWETLRRFARLQQQFGRWGLAWLESLVRCADIAASRVQTPSATSAEALP